MEYTPPTEFLMLFVFIRNWTWSAVLSCSYKTSLVASKQGSTAKKAKLL